MKIVLMTILMFVFPVFVYASTGVNIAITPPLIKLNMSPGEELTTAIKIINNGEKKMIINAQVRDFDNDENGKINFLEKGDMDPDQVDMKSLLSNWISIRSDVITIPPFQSKNITFTIKVPESAGPGSHYAAILAGNNPNDKQSGTNINISSYVSSIILLNIKGDVTESGEIRNFSTDKSIYKNPQVVFNVKFQNRGNVYLHPEGDIKVYDFWNNEVGSISINKDSSFGNVLPNSFKQWNFNWSQKKDIFKMGRYTAKLAFTFGSDNKNTDYREINFWIIDFEIIGYVIGSILLLIIGLVFFVKFSIKRSVDRIKMQVDEYNYKYRHKSYQPKLINKKQTLDLRSKKNDK